METDYITLNSRYCVACWKCIHKCPNNVLGKISFFGHKHARIRYPEKCTGCLACVGICDAKAITSIN